MREFGKTPRKYEEIGEDMKIIQENSGGQKRIRKNPKEYEKI